MQRRLNLAAINAPTAPPPDIYAPVDSFSLINNLFPSVYSVEITDDMGCIINDSIEVKSNPAICITVYKVFSPNDDNTHEFWEIENINLYPEALVQVYDRTGRQVYNRRNYINAEEDAFSGKDQQGRTLPSGTHRHEDRAPALSALPQARTCHRLRPLPAV